jgi:hypothetical protein
VFSRFFVAAAIVAAAVSVAGPGAADAPLPAVDKESHMGVFSCAGSTCHGAVEPWADANVLQNEYITWQRQDKHAKAYQVLLEERSKRIARNLGLKDAHTAEICLVCHADNVAPERRFRTFQISDGVTCEACHGGAGRWIGTHITADATHKNNVENGLYPTDEPVARARLCLSCHFGSLSSPMTHRIMGAGHPRMSFELDTFTAIQPAHFKVDDDYRRRKGDWNGIQFWAVGQVVAVGNLLDALLDPKRRRDGIFPELALFDCHTCHRPMENPKWRPRSTVGLGPGKVRVNDSNMLMLQVIMRRVDTGLAEEFRTRTLALHRSTAANFDAFDASAKALRQTTERVVAKLAAHRFGNDDMKALLEGVIAYGLNGQFVDYSGAEQATMAIGTIINAMRNTGIVSSDQFAVMDKAYKGVFATVDKDESYRSGAFVGALKAFQKSIP